MPPALSAAAALLLLSALLGVAEACSSRSTPKPRPPAPTARPNVTFHTYACPPAYAAYYCLNGATCFTVKIAESLMYSCECSDGYMGNRCEFKDLDGSYLPVRQRVVLERASIASGASVAVILVVVVCIAFYMHCQRRLGSKASSMTLPHTLPQPTQPVSTSLHVTTPSSPLSLSVPPPLYQLERSTWPWRTTIVVPVETLHRPCRPERPPPLPT